MAAEDVDMSTNVEERQGHGPLPPVPPGAAQQQVPPAMGESQGPVAAPAAAALDQPVAPRPEPSAMVKPARKLPINTGNLLLVGLFAAGIGCLYLLSLRSGPEAASADRQILAAQIDAALVQMQNPVQAAGDDAGAVVDTFYYEAKQRQIPISMLSGNAFVYRPGPAGIGPATAGRSGSQRPPDQSSAYALQTAQQLQLQCVMMGTNGVATAMISGDLVTQGQVIKGWTARSIKPREVLLTRDGVEYVLRMPR